MADNYLERHREDYEKRKRDWIKRNKRYVIQSRFISKPEDESL